MIVVTVWLALFINPKTNTWDAMPTVFKTSQECDAYVNNVVRTTGIVDIACEQVKITVKQ